MKFIYLIITAAKSNNWANQLSFKIISKNKTFSNLVFQILFHREIDVGQVSTLPPGCLPVSSSSCENAIFSGARCCRCFIPKRIHRIQLHSCKLTSLQIPFGVPFFDERTLERTMDVEKREEYRNQKSWKIKKVRTTLTMVKHGKNAVRKYISLNKRKKGKSRVNFSYIAPLIHFSVNPLGAAPRTVRKRAGEQFFIFF